MGWRYGARELEKVPESARGARMSMLGSRYASLGLSGRVSRVRLTVRCRMCRIEMFGICNMALIVFGFCVALWAVSDLRVF